ncbi:MAG: phosphopantetheine-binding protein [Lachnospiraceae bacterium]|nr:phosphopantetheine-binding protein [Lachnospiraceae bacterium]
MSAANNDRFIELIREYSNTDLEITGEVRFREDLSFSSLDFMSFLGELEDAFDIEIDLERAKNLVTVQDALDYLTELTD